MRRVVVAIGLIGLVFASLSIGAADLSSDQGGAFLLTVSRVPRTAAALLAGAGLALAGAVVQLAVQNRLVEPGLTGTPEAAMAGLLAITLIAPGAPLMVKMVAASTTALAGTAGFLLLARHVPRQDPMLLPLVGLIYAGILGAGVTGVAWSVDLMQYLGTWQAGEFSGVLRGRYELLWIIAIAGGLLYLAADRITLLGLGEDRARSLGLNARQTLLAGLVIVAVMVTATVVTVGVLPFVGLIIPNLVSRWRGDNLRANLPLIALAGGTAVLASDLIGRLIRWPYEIPAGTIFAVAGAAIFLWLLYAAPSQRDARG
ncbi:MAG TPA: iron chelate uptake ABC transporter family permease subunit [Paracoccus sp. (in: a-proteobacteria)]|uniref:iron chelate uptake ABC transporter family permease subunit n=1 Tax=uncultured Paracoccus sp. TaxID=189685 RepID=UPI002628C91E|nr:iron chelate uptake ABC transporter family permease subunit [uncultured Paracoccus sp.]HMQ40407.1 iron chelate uptake ABC transporter family permease subunit [Paracoccus sp. (in: a-proteobacteria)]HMR35599.1 iron chelate uptake ABC transporter family permease subunit [Paracoccus sp. (in: a-proteobacteria)]